MDLERRRGAWEETIVFVDPGRDVFEMLHVRTTNVIRVDARTARIEANETVGFGRNRRSYTLTLVLHDGD